MEPATGPVAPAVAADRVPVTVVAGFLGSGKTTLLNHILAGDHGLRVAVLVNDFGSLDIDSRLIVARDATMITLDNGCICCSVRADLVAQLTDLVEGPARPEHILVETSGVSDPGRILVALRDPHLRTHARVDGVITLVDVSAADLIPPQHEELARRQLATADLIVLNKADLVTPDELAARRSRLTYPRARVTETVYGRVPLGVLLGIAGDTETDAGGREHAREAHAHDHHAEAFSTWTWTSTAPLRLAAVREVLATLPADVFRVKGFLHLAEEPERRVVAHVVGRRVDLRPFGRWNGAEARTELVFVSLEPRIDAVRLGQQLAGAAASPRREERSSAA